LNARSLPQLENKLDTIFSDEAVNELVTIQDMVRWAVTEFNRAGLFYGMALIMRGMKQYSLFYLR